MKAESYLLDTDVAVETINDPVRSADRLIGRRVAISSVTAYELAVGMEKCDSTRTARETREFLEASEIIDFCWRAAMRSARVRAELESRGMGIGPYDTLIAGHCLFLGRILISNNGKEFGRVGGLRLESLAG